MFFKDGARYNAIGPWLKEYFGGRIAKLAVDGGFTCPNRDGSLSFEGCTYCSRTGSGDFAGDRRETITSQLDSQHKIMSAKWPDFRCIAYFQNYTNTYAPAAVLREKYEEALSYPDCCGIAIATRPDCIDDEVLSLLSDINDRTFLWVELGLQTSNDRTADLINRCCSTDVYDETVNRLVKAGIRVVTHVIFGLPGESHEDMLETVRHICRAPIFGIKLHLLHLMTGTAMGHEYLCQQADLSFSCDKSGPVISGDPVQAPEPGRLLPDHPSSPDPDRPLIRVMEKDEYISLVADALEIIPAEITMHRLTGDAPPDLLIAPEWCLKKADVLNGINKELKKRGSLQGCRVRTE